MLKNQVLATFDLLSGFPENLLFPYFNFLGFWACSRFSAFAKRGVCKRGLRKLGHRTYQLHSNYIPETWSKHDLSLTAMYIQPAYQGIITHDRSVHHA